MSAADDDNDGNEESRNPPKQEKPPTYTPAQFMSDVNTRLTEIGLPPYEKLPHLSNVIGKSWPNTVDEITKAGSFAIEHKRTEPTIEAIRKDIPAYKTNQQVRDAIENLGMELIPDDAEYMDALHSALSDLASEKQAK